MNERFTTLDPLEDTETYFDDLGSFSPHMDSLHSIH